MKKITFLLLMISAAAHAQESGFHRFLIAPNVSVNYCYRTLVKNSESYEANILTQFKNSSEVPKPAMNMGISACYTISRHVGIEAGVQYANRGYQTTMMPFNFADGFDPGNQTVATSGKFVYGYHYLDIPVKANFTFGQKRVRLAAGVGLVSSVFILETNTAVDQNSDGSVDRHADSRNNRGADTALLGRINGFNWSPLLSAGVDIRIDDRMSLRIEPTFYYGLKTIISNTPVDEYLWSGGINAAYYIALGSK